MWRCTCEYSSLCWSYYFAVRKWGSDDKWCTKWTDFVSIKKKTTHKLCISASQVEKGAVLSFALLTRVLSLQYQYLVFFPDESMSFLYGASVLADSASGALSHLHLADAFCLTVIQTYIHTLMALCLWSSNHCWGSVIDSVVYTKIPQSAAHSSFSANIGQMFLHWAERDAAQRANIAACTENENYEKGSHKNG